MNWGRKFELKDLCKTDREIYLCADWVGIPEKEIRESFDFVKRVRKACKGRDVLEVCCGHSLISNILVSKNIAKTCTAVDKHYTRANSVLTGLLNNNSRVFLNIHDIYDEKINQYDFDIVIGCHCCGDLTDRAIEIALDNNKNVAVCPCCHQKQKSNNQVKNIFGSQGLDIMRCCRLDLNGYKLSLKQMPQSITLKNNIIIGVKYNE